MDKLVVTFFISIFFAGILLAEEPILHENNSIFSFPIKDFSKIAMSSSEKIVKVRKAEEFPNELKSEQSIALFLHQIEQANLQFSAKIEKDKVDSKTETRNNSLAISISFNKHLLLSSAVKSENISTVIPSVYLEKGENVLVIKNLSLADFY